MQSKLKTGIKGPHTVGVLGNIKISNGIGKLVLDNKTIAESSKPGQFVSILCKNLVLRRPFSVAGTDGNKFEILYKIKGKGTQYLASLKAGDKADIIGPFGNGFGIEDKNSLLIGCGVGIAPMLFLKKSLELQKTKHTLVACSQTFFREISLSTDDVVITEDGSHGLKGRLDNYLENIINENMPEKIYTCGPNPAMSYISQIAKKYNIPVEAALEREFACGTGVCMGCVIQVNRDDKILNKRICKDGPVFDGNEVLW